MAGHRVVYTGDASTIGGSISLHDQRVSCSSEPLDPRFLSGSSPFLLGSRSTVSFKDVNGVKRSERPFFLSFDQEEIVDEELEEYLYQPEKKRRLTVDQVRFLETNFELDNKLEPERKFQLAKDLGVQPRQVAIWFQNRRSRSKMKQLEMDYEALQASYDSLRADYDDLLKEKEILKAEVLNLTEKLLLELKEDGNLEPSDTNQQAQATLGEPTTNSISVGEKSKVSADSNRPLNIDGGHCSLLEFADSSYIYEPDQSDLSHDEEDNFSKSLFPPSSRMFPTIRHADFPDSPADSCFFGFPIEEHALKFWSY